MCNFCVKQREERDVNLSIGSVIRRALVESSGLAAVDPFLLSGKSVTLT